MRGWRRKSRFWCLCFVPMVFEVCCAWAATEVSVNPIVEVLGEYRSNVFFVEGGDEEDLVTVLFPAIEGTLNTERLSSSLYLSAQRELFLNQGEMDATNQFHLLKVLFELDPKWSFGSKCSFGEDHGTERALAETGILIRRSTRRRWSPTVSMAYAFDERTALNSIFYATWNEYEDPRLLDFRTQTGMLALSRELGHRIPTLWTEAGVSHWDYPVRSFLSAILRASIERRISEILTFDASIGYRYIRGSDGDSSEEHNVEAALGLAKDFESFRLELLGDRRIVPSPLGFPVVQNRGNLTLVWRPLARLSGYLAGHALHTEAVRKDDGLESQSLEGTLGFGFLAHRTVAIGLYYQYLRYDNRIRDSEIDGHYVTLNIRVQMETIPDAVVTAPLRAERYVIHEY